MIFRCDLQHFLVHAIDYLSLQDLTNMQYAVISSKMSVSGRALNVSKVNQLYPDIDTICAWADYKDKDLLRKMYFGMLSLKDEKLDKDESNEFHNCIYQVFINPLLEHYNIMIVCDKEENVFIDLLCEYLKENFYIEVIDLNELFTKGRIGHIYIDRDEIRDKAVDIRRAALKEQIRNMASTREGKAALISKMSDKEKKKQLKKYGVKLRDNEMEDIDEILLDEWTEQDGDDIDIYSEDDED